jgi:hypothetical protein
MGVLEKVRKWIDGDTAETVLEEAARDAQIKPRSEAEAFIVKIARAVEEVMQREMVPLPQGTTLIPTEYIIFLSEEDDKDWQGVKRRGLEQGLYHILAERAREISGKRKIETQSFAVELRVDGTLETGDIRVQHGWEDSSTGKTEVAARPKPAERPQSATSPIAAQSFARTSDGNVEEMTRVTQRAQELYRLEVWREGVRQSVLPVFQNQLAIGRGSASKPVDVVLSGDPEISRRHATISCDPQGNFWLLCEGRNPLVAGGREIETGERIAVRPGEAFGICSYTLRIQPH